MVPSETIKKPSLNMRVSMSEVDDRKLMNRVRELLSRDNNTRIQETGVQDHHNMNTRLIRETRDDHRITKLRKNQNTVFKKPKSPRFSSRKLIPAVEIPEVLKNRILETGGRLDTVRFVIQKELFKSDVEHNLNRLSLPYRQSKMNFLRPDEVGCLDAAKGGGIQATLIEPCLEECEISLRNWKSNSMYALVSSWNEVRRRNNLETAGTNIQLWSFRRNSRLCFGLVVSP